MKIAIGCLLAVCLLLLVPTIPAVEFHTAVETNKQVVLETVQTKTIKELREKIKTLTIDELKQFVRLDLKSSKEAMEKLFGTKTFGTNPFSAIRKFIYLVTDFLGGLLMAVFYIMDYHGFYGAAALLLYILAMMFFFIGAIFWPEQFQFPVRY
jgi:hypothetical protein